LPFLNLLFSQDDTSYYSAIIMEFVANGAKEQTDCWFEVATPPLTAVPDPCTQVQPYPHTFTSQLKPKNCVENDEVTFEIDTEAADAEVRRRGFGDQSCCQMLPSLNRD
jgi:hypothetical protein